GVDAHHRLHGHMDVGGHATKTGVEGNPLAIHVEGGHRPGGDIEHDLPVRHVGLGHGDPLHIGIHHQVGGAVVVDDPVVERLEQIGTIGSHGGHCDHFPWDSLCGVAEGLVAVALCPGGLNAFPVPGR